MFRHSQAREKLPRKRRRVLQAEQVRAQVRRHAQAFGISEASVSSVTGSTRRNAISTALLENTGAGLGELKGNAKLNRLSEMVLDARACLNHGKNSVQTLDEVSVELNSTFLRRGDEAGAVLPDEF